MGAGFFKDNLSTPNKTVNGLAPSSSHIPISGRWTNLAGCPLQGCLGNQCAGVSHPAMQNGPGMGNRYDSRPANDQLSCFHLFLFSRIPLI